MHTNLLIHETSPYLLQHAHNPVNWRPWGEEAFRIAREQNKPIFLSVGYSTCYWCHVMERESFENEEVAKILNEHFVAIKVDREERPDIDEQYMLAAQLMTGRGGWPNSVWLTADGIPWMAGAYFPRERFIRVLKQLAQVWRERPEAVAKQARAFEEEIARATSAVQGAEKHELNRQLVDGVLSTLSGRFDSRHGGFGGAPKFPPHGALRLLLHEMGRTPDPDPRWRRMAMLTLDSMWRGGVHDHVGGGFHRYATDDHWLLPHFEKMLYDNAQLMRAYTEAHVITKKPDYRLAAADIFRWLEREMTHPDGAFYSAVDSESEGEEGKFYVWTLEELKDVLGDDAPLWAEVYGCEPQGNFREEATGRRTGGNIPHLPKPIEEVASEKGERPEPFAERLASMRDRLLDARNQRESPHRDDKILTSWNGMMIASLALAGDQLDEPRYTSAAARAADFLLDNLWKDGLLQRTWRNGQPRVPAYLDDHASLAEGLLQLHRATGDSRWLRQAQRVTDVMLELFQDEADGGFFFTSEHHQELITRSKNLMGGGNVPSGNGVAAQVLLDLEEITGEEKYFEAAKRTLDSLTGVMIETGASADIMVVAAATLVERQQTAAPADGRYVIGPVTAKVRVSQETIQPGRTLQVEVKLTIEEGWRLYAESPGADFLKPTTLAFRPVAGVTAGDVKTPTPIVKFDPVVSRELAIYEGDVVFRAPLTIATDAPAGEINLQFDLKTQACDRQRCLAPTTTTLSLPVRVSRD